MSQALTHKMYISTHTSLAVLIQEGMRSEERKRKVCSLKGQEQKKTGYTWFPPWDHIKLKSDENSYTLKAGKQKMSQNKISKNDKC